MLCESLRAGWNGDPAMTGGDASQVLVRMSFVGKQQCKALMEFLKTNLDWSWGMGQVGLDELSICMNKPVEDAIHSPESSVFDHCQDHFDFKLLSMY